MSNATGKKLGLGIYIAILLTGAVLIGAILGAMILNSLLYDEDDSLVTAIVSPPLTGMETLFQYRCSKAESKQVILGGIEDNYAASGDETVTYSSVHKHMESRIGKKGAVTLDRSYDEGGMDKFFLDRIAVPTNTVHGLFVVKARSLTERTNDSLNVGQMSTYAERKNNYGTLFSNMQKSNIWTVEGNVHSVKLSNLIFRNKVNQNNERISNNYKNVLNFIQSGPEDTQLVDIYIGDDHIIDFMGVAACLPPPIKRGTSLLVRPFPKVKDVVELSCSTEAREDHCDPYKGDTLCKMALPLACFDYTGETAPLEVRAAGGDKIWSHGRVKFTPSVRGDRFQTSDEAHAYCAASFDENYRVATFQENLRRQLEFSAYGGSNVSQVWVHAKTEPYGNCWDLVTDYEQASQ